MKKIAIVDNSLWPDIYNPVEHWSAWLDLPVEAFRVADGYLPDLENDYTHLIITGSEASIVDFHPWVQPETELIREALDRGLAILGSCYGHQLLALSLGGPEYVRRAERPEIGWIEIEILKNDLLIGEKGNHFVFSSHYDEIIDLDESTFEVLARSRDCQIQAFRLKGERLWGIQAHPEINPDSARQLLQGMLDKGFPGADLISKTLRQQAKDDGWIKTICQNFVDL
ncbi:MAG: type 1 glutamine amidotransferase [Acidobacteriota bacterium]|nr:type 1 glutamine amidotransferase [Acidobacteriota bacterium]MDW3228806.1 type 1 glutamine amidotransferase [Acidobacteriota bacterium]